MLTIFSRHESPGERVAGVLRAHPLLATASASALLVAIVGSWLYARATTVQAPDPSFDARVGAPAYLDRHPVVLIDGAHWNFHTADFRYRPFADLLRSDGYVVEGSRDPITRDLLGGVDVLVIANALGAKGAAAMTANAAGLNSALDWELDAFDEQECEELEQWVAGGGSLLLVADHKPCGSAAARLAARFGVSMSNSYTEDISHCDPQTGMWNHIVYDRQTGLAGGHAITEGRGTEERVSRVITYTGQSLSGPPGAVALLRLSDEAEDYPSMNSTKSEGVGVAGRAQALAFEHGSGRVVVCGEAAMLTAQVVRGGGRELRIGLGREGYDNRRFALNIMHWLSRLG